MLTSLESRFEDYKKSSSPKPNIHLLSIMKAAQDACLRLGSLKTTYSKMRFGVTEFQRYYLEVCGSLDYLEIYKPRMDGQKPPAETAANCIGAFTNVARIAQDFHTAGLPVWLLRPSELWDTPVECNILEVVTPVNPTDALCVSPHDPPFAPIFSGPASHPNRHGAIHIYSRHWLAFKDPFDGGSSKGQLIYLCATTLSYHFTAVKPSITQSADGDKISPPPKGSQSPARGVSGVSTSQKACSLTEYCICKPRNLKPSGLVIATSSCRWTLLLLRSRFLPGAIHYGMSTDRLLV